MSYRHVQELELVREEREAAGAAVAYAEQHWPRLYQLHDSTVNYEHLTRTIRNLERTYLIRLFSEFEGILRRHLEASQPGRAVPRDVYNVINRVARARHIRDNIRDGAHLVREYRNALVHGHPEPPALSFREAMAHLNRFLAPLPD